MISFRNTLATTILAVSMGLSASVQAELLLNSWDPFYVIVEQNPDVACGDADEFVAEGMSHVKVSTLRNGNVALNVNAMGTFTAVGSEEGAIFRQNIRDVLPIDGENVVYNYGETIKIIGRPNGDNYRANINFHVAIIDGEWKSSIDIDKAECW